MLISNSLHLLALSQISFVAHDQPFPRPSLVLCCFGASKVGRHSCTVTQMSVFTYESFHLYHGKYIYCLDAFVLLLEEKLGCVGKPMLCER